MKLLQITALALCLNIPMAHAGRDESMLCTLAKAGAFISINAAGAAAVIMYEGCVAPRTTHPLSLDRGGLSATHLLIAATVITIPLGMAINAAESAIDALNI